MLELSLILCALSDLGFWSCTICRMDGRRLSDLIGTRRCGAFIMVTPPRLLWTTRCGHFGNKAIWEKRLEIIQIILYGLHKKFLAPLPRASQEATQGSPREKSHQNCDLFTTSRPPPAMNPSTDIYNKTIMVLSKHLKDWTVRQGSKDIFKSFLCNPSQPA